MLNILQQVNEIQNAEKYHVDKFSLRGSNKIAKCISVHDGDTFTALVKIERVCELRCRLINCDTSEIVGGNERTKQLGRIARAALSQKISGKYVLLEFGDFDAFGRALVTVYELDQQTYERMPNSVNKFMIESGNAIEYMNGGSHDKKKNEIDMTMQSMSVLDIIAEYRKINTTNAGIV